MGSIVKSIGRTIKKVAKKVGRFVKKNAPYILLAAAMWAGMGAYGASLGTTGSANIFGWTNVKAGASALGSNVWALSQEGVKRQVRAAFHQQKFLRGNKLLGQLVEAHSKKE